MSEPHASEPRVYFVGAGPGAADLLTLRAVRVLARADYVLHDALVEATVLDTGTTRDAHCGRQARSASLYCTTLHQQDAGRLRAQSAVCRAAEGRRPVDLRPTRRRDAGAACRRNSFEVVPGITAASAAAAELQASLTLRGVARAVTFLTPCVCDEHDDATWAPAIESLRAGGTLGVYMAGRHIAATAQRLIESGELASTPIAILESVSLAESRHWLGTLATASFHHPR